jgi:hypothetical protein
MAAFSKRLRRAATAMREDHGPDHKRHKMWCDMATLLEAVADDYDTEDGTYGGFDSSVYTGARNVATAYLEARKAD